MQNKFKYQLLLIVALLLVLPFSCERDFDELELATFPTDGAVFLDGFSPGLAYAAFGGSDVTAFNVDTDIAYEGASSMRFEVPDPEQPNGSYAGGEFLVPDGRDLSGYNVLTFWARASQAANIDEIGLGSNEFRAILNNVPVTPNWQQYYLPIPDASLLTQESIMLFYTEAPENGRGYTFWMDEVRFEKLGTIAHSSSAILLGQEQNTQAETGDKLQIGGLTSTANTPEGVDQVVNTGAGYFTFSSSNPSVATVNSTGEVTVLDEGTAIITASLAGETSNGSLTVEGTGEPLLPPNSAPVPTVPQDSVISMYSNVYEDVLVDTWNPFWEFSTTIDDEVKVGDDDMRRYKMLNFVGILTESAPIDATEMTHFHLDMWTPDATDQPAAFRILLVDFGPDNSFGGGDDSSHELSFTAPTLKTEEWVSFDIPLSNFVGLTNRAQISQLVLSGDIPNVFIDNVYYYKGEEVAGAEPETAAPTPSFNASNVISLFSDAYDDVPVDTWRTDWSNTAFEDVEVDGNPTKKYSALDFVGIETVNNTVDASGMTNFRMDVWSAEFTQFSVKLVDFGADGAFGGGDDSEFQIDVPMPAQNQWVDLDFKLSDFTALTSTANIAQYILVGQPTGGTTVFVDNMLFYNDDGSGTGSDTEPTQAAPAPTQNAADVISLFSDVYTDVPVDTWRTDWSAADFEDVTVADNPTKKYSNLDFVGIETVMNPIDATGMTNFRMDVWSADFTFLGVKLVDFGADGAFGGGDDVEHQINVEMPAQGQWVSLDFPLSDFTSLTTRGSVAQFIIAGQPTGTTTVFVDNMYFYNSDGMGTATEPTQAAPTPMQMESEVTSLFSDAYTDVPVDTWRTDWSAADFEDVTVADNPTKKYSNLDFVGIETVMNPVDVSNRTHIHMDVWSADFTFFGVKLVDFGADGAFGGGDDVEHQVNIEMPAQGQWVGLDIPLSDFTGLTTRSNLAQYIIAGQPTGATTVFIDNIYFYGDDSGGVTTEPTEAAPTPMQMQSEVTSLFSEAYNDVAVDTWRTDWSSADFEDVMVAGNATKKYSNLDFVGIETVMNPVDVSNRTHIHMDVWSADFTFFGVKLVDFGADGAFGGGDDAEHQVNIEMPAQGQWVGLDIPLSDFTGLTTRSNLAQYIIAGQPTGTTTVFIDNIYFYGEDAGGVATEPSEAAPAPMQDAAQVTSIFSDAYTDATVDTWRTDWSAATFEDVMIAGNATKKYSDLDFVGIETAMNPVDVSNRTHFHIDVWSPDFTTFGIKIVDFGPDGVFGTDDTEHQINFDMPAQGEWVSYDIPLSDFTGLTTTGSIAQFILVGQPTGTSTIFVDNMYFYGEDTGGVTNEPTEAAPTPSQDEANVISLFSDAYTDAPVDTWRTDWSSAAFEDVMVAGNATKKYSALDFVGIETVANTVDASEMTHFRIDVWSADFTFFGIKLVDFGADGAFGGGDDVEHQINFEMPAQGGWISYDIPLSDFTGLTTTSNIAQYILVGQPTGTNTIFVDNMYFYKQ